jgi:hypothetical protein
VIGIGLLIIGAALAMGAVALVVVMLLRERN